MISFEEYCGPCGCGDRACGAWGGGPWYCGPVGCAPGGLLGGGGLAWAARGALARPSRTKARAMVRVMMRIGSGAPLEIEDRPCPLRFSLSDKVPTSMS